MSDFINDFFPFVMLVLIVGILLTLRILAGKNHLPGRIIRWWWNASFKLCSYIPLCGWMAHLIIADTTNEKGRKAERIHGGEEADAAGIAALDKAAARNRAELDAIEARADLERQINYELKRTDAHIISDDVVEIGGKKYRLSDVKDKLHIP